MRKKILCLIMGLVMTAGMTLTASAEDYKGATNWLSEFNGSDIVSNFDRVNVAESLTGVQPGDSMELYVTVKNSYSQAADWYMTNEVVQTLEDAMTTATGGAYAYRLTYTDTGGASRVIYESDTVGGEDTVNGEGLYTIDNSAQEYFYLDRLASGETGLVTLWLEVEGETQGNGYQLTLAELRLNFAVEVVPNAEVTTVVEHHVNRVSSGTVTRVTTVQTGDASQLLLWSALGLACGGVLLFFGIRTFKNREKKGE